MTVSSIVPVNTYTGNSTVKKFDFDFLIESENELIVQHISEDNVITTLTLGVDYSINEIGNQNGRGTRNVKRLEKMPLHIPVPVAIIVFTNHSGICLEVSASAVVLG